MNRGEKVQVKTLAKVENEYRGRTGTVLADSAPGELVRVEFDDEAVEHHFLPEELERIS